MRSPTIAFLVVASMLTGCAGLYSTGACDLHCESRPDYDQDEPGTGTMVMVGAVVVTAFALAIYATSRTSDKPAPTTAVRPSLPEHDLAQARSLARDGQCGPMAQIGRRLELGAPWAYQQFVDDPMIARCLGAPTTALR